MNPKKTTEDILDMCENFLKIPIERKNNNIIFPNPIELMNMEWLPVDKVRKEINRLFEKYLVPDDEPKVIINGLNLITVINHPISAYHGELLEVLGLLEEEKGQTGGTPLDVCKTANVAGEEPVSSLSSSSPKKPEYFIQGLAKEHKANKDFNKYMNKKKGDA